MENIESKPDYGESLLSLLKMQSEMIIKSHSVKTPPNINPTVSETIRASIQIQDDLNILHETMLKFYQRMVPEYEYRKKPPHYDTTD